MPNVQVGSSTAYTYAQLEGLWIQAGGPRALAPVAAAVALAESRGDPTALNPTDNNGTQSSYGLWQISNGTHAPPAPNWQNPHVNARLAVAKWKAAGDSFSPWGTYTSGAYKSFLSNRTTPEAVSGSAPPPAAPASGPDCLVGLPGVLGGGCALTRSEIRAMIGGTLMGIGGLVGLTGLAILMAAALTGSKAAGKVADAAAVVPVPGAQAVSAGLHRARRAPAKRQAAARKRASTKPKAKAKAAPAAPKTYSGSSPSGTAPPPAQKRPSKPPRAPGMGPSKGGTPPPRPRKPKPKGP